MLAKEANDEVSMAATSVWLFLVGFVLMSIGVVVLFVASTLQGNANTSIGGVVFIGPIPIAFGAGPNAYLAIILATILTIIGFIVFFLMRKSRV